MSVNWILLILNCFYMFVFSALFESGYHGHPYHNSTHAADVTQAMHCYLQESKVMKHWAFTTQFFPQWSFKKSFLHMATKFFSKRQVPYPRFNKTLYNLSEDSVGALNGQGDRCIWLQWFCSSLIGSNNENSWLLHLAKKPQSVL